MKKISILLFSVAALILSSCAGDFLERPSKTTMNDENFWSSEGNIRLFVNGGFTNYFCGYYSGWSYNYAPGVRGDGANSEFSDDVLKSGTQQEPYVAATSFNGYSTSESNTFYSRSQSCAWNFAWVRKWNLLIERLNMMNEKGILTGEAFNHWMGVARFLRSYEYSRLVLSFGDVPYYDAVIDAEYIATQYKQRDSRVMVMTKAKEDFEFAMQNVRTDDGPNFINKGVVGTIGSRWMLMEGTWEKYHKTPGGTPQVFLQSAQNLAKAVMDLGIYKFDTSVKDLFGATSKIGNETIFYRSYSAAISVRHCIATYCMPQYGQGGYANFNHLESWICNDGKVYTISDVPNAKSWKVKDMDLTRDPRFESTFYDEPNSSAGGNLFCWKFIDRQGPEYYYDNAYHGGPAIPSQYGGARNENGAPVIRYAETVLNYIEAKAELAASYGGPAVTQADLDASINAIRQRPLDAHATALGLKKTAPLTLALAEQNAAADPQYNDAVYKVTLAYRNGFTPSPLIWEIRRERRMEFFNEHVRATDIRRWGEMERMNNETNPKTTYGVYVSHEDLGEDNAAYRVGDDHKTNMGDPRYFGHFKKQFTLARGNLDKFKVYTLDGRIVTYTGSSDASGAVTGTNFNELDGFCIPTNFVNRQPIEENDYLLPIPTSVVNQYSQKAEVDSSVQPIQQNPGW